MKSGFRRGLETRLSSAIECHAVPRVAFCHRITSTSMFALHLLGGTPPPQQPKAILRAACLDMLSRPEGVETWLSTTSNGRMTMNNVSTTVDEADRRLRRRASLQITILHFSLRSSRRWPIFCAWACLMHTSDLRGPAPIAGRSGCGARERETDPPDDQGPKHGLLSVPAHIHTHTHTHIHTHDMTHAQPAAHPARNKTHRIWCL